MICTNGIIIKGFVEGFTKAIDDESEIASIDIKKTNIDTHHVVIYADEKSVEFI